MKRTLAEVVQIVQKIKAKFGPNKDLEDSYYHKGFIGVKDLFQAERMIIKFIQWHALADKMKTLLPWNSWGKSIKQYSETRSIFSQ